MNRIRRSGTTFFIKRLNTKYFMNSHSDTRVNINNIHRQFSIYLKHNPEKKITLASVLRHRNFFIARKISKDSKSSEDEKMKENPEISSILRDFASDFEIDEESSKLLEDIKKNQQNFPNNENRTSTTAESDTLTSYQSISKSKFKEFEDADSSIIYSYEEEPFLEKDDDFFHIDKSRVNTVREAKRGVTGVYDIDELVDVLREENTFDIAVIKIPECCHYADFMVLANAKSPRHARAVVELVIKFYKMKKNKEDPFLKVEGEKFGTWRAIDMGNIVLHIFLEDARTCYDIESLWLLDREFDSGGQNQDEDDVVDILKEQMAFLETLKLNETKTDVDEIK